MPGNITAIRFWKLKGETVNGPHIGHLWSATGVQLARVAFTAETADGWQEQALAPPLRFLPGAPLVVSVNTIAGAHFPMVKNGFASAWVNGHLFAGASAGVYGPSGVFPASPSPHDYFRDLRFEPDPVKRPSVVLRVAPPPTPTSTSIGVTGAVTGLTPGRYALTLTIRDEASGQQTTGPVVLTTVVEP